VVVIAVCALARPPAQEGEGVRGAWRSASPPATYPPKLAWPDQEFWDRVRVGIKPIRDPVSPEMLRRLPGNPVDIDFQGTPFRDALAMLGRAAGVSISLDPAVSRRVAATPITLIAPSLELRDALDLVLMQASADGHIICELLGDSIRVRPK
jgi:hypothetical protein